VHSAVCDGVRFDASTRCISRHTAPSVFRPMRTLLAAAAATTTLVGLAHSVLGEVMIFQKVRRAGLVPKEAAPPLQSRNIRILWATWHLASIFGVGFSGILIALARSDSPPDTLVMRSLVLSLAASAAMVFGATRGKHPGWIGLLAAAVLAFAGRAS
jgi:hypothetical protein